jgi:hypothetical protein
MHQREEHTSRFTARSSDGREFVIDVFTTIFTTHGDKGAFETQGGRRLQLDDGRSVRQLGVGKYQVINPRGGGITVTSDDPSAP